jgi:penicillin-binding protein 1C
LKLETLNLKFFCSYRKIILLVIGSGLLSWFLFCVPRPLFREDYSTVIESREGELLDARISKDGQWRFPAPDSVPHRFSKCIITFEDVYFYRHPGINPVSLVRALIQDIRAGKIVSGGSTITMQVARLARDGKRRNVWNKLVEMIWAINLEMRFPKKEILKMYVTHAPFGGNVVGLEGASWRYFNQPPQQLSWSESATLAVLPNAPSLIFPGKNDTVLLKKRNRLLKKLFDHLIIDSLTFSLSLTEPIPRKVYAIPEESYHLMQYAMQADRGKRTRTTLDFQLQQAVNQAVKGWFRQLKAIKVFNAGALVTEVKTGRVLAYTGNIPDLPDSLHGNHVDVIRAPRSTGSILKPFLYAALLDKGMITPQQLIPDIPVRFSDFAPENFSHEFDGAVPAARALARSLNVPAVKMLQQYGVEPFYYFLKKAGMTTLVFSPDHYGLSLILGGAETSLWDLGGMYTSLAGIVRQYEEHDGLYSVAPFKPLIWKDPEQWEPGKEATQPFVKASSVWLTLQALLEVNRPEEETGWESFAGARKIAWKTGTSFGFRDGWAIGITRDYVVSVWTGNCDGEGRPGLTGSSVAAPLMFGIFGLLPQDKWFSEPADELTPTILCRQSGYLPSPWCADTDTFKIPAGARPGQCPFCRLIHLDKEQRFRVSGDCYPVSDMLNKSWFVLPPVMEHYFRKKNPGYQPLPPVRPGCEAREEAMDFIYPQELDRIFIPKPLDGSQGQVIFELAHRNPEAIIYWYLDKVYLGKTTAFHQMNVYAPPGWHTLTVTDMNGNQLVKQFQVVDK